MLISFKRVLDGSPIETVEEPYGREVHYARDDAKHIREAGSPPAHGAFKGLFAFIDIVQAVLKAELENHTE